MTSVELVSELGLPEVKFVGSGGRDQLHRSQTGPLRVTFGLSNPIWSPPTDVYDTGDDIVVRVEVAGMREEDFSITLDGRTLLISGVRNLPQERCAFHRMEIPSGEFRCEVDLPHPVVTDEVSAVYKEGFLRIVLPRAKPQRIQVEE